MIGYVYLLQLIGLYDTVHAHETARKKFQVDMHLQFEIPSVRIDNSTWTWLTKEKLETLKLSTEAVVDKLSVGYESFSGKSRLVISHDPNAANAHDILTTLHNTTPRLNFDP